MSILHGYMGIVGSGAEIWGPVGKVATAGHNLVETARFDRGELQVIDNKACALLNVAPYRTNDDMVEYLAKGNDDARLMENALAILNQLAVEDRTVHDVHSVVVYEDFPSAIATSRTGAGKHHQWYKIDWIQRPDAPGIITAKKQAREQLEKDREARIEATQVIRERKAATYRLLNWGSHRPPAAAIAVTKEEVDEHIAGKARSAEIEVKFKEAQAIDNVVIDRTRYLTLLWIHNGNVKIELDPNGKAIMLGREHYDDGDFTPIDENYRIHPLFRWQGSAQKHYESLLSLAAKAEGKAEIYIPEQLAPEVYQDIYDRGLKSGMLKVESDPEGNVSFFYQGYGNVYDVVTEEKIEYAEMDLDNDAVEGLDHFHSDLRRPARPINPHFAAFLRQKKAELEQKPR